MKRILYILLPLVLCLGNLFAQTSLEDVRKNAVTNNVTESFDVPTGLTLGVDSGGTLSQAVGSVWSYKGVTIDTLGEELNFLSGVSSNVQDQLDTKAPVASPTFTGVVTIPSPFNLGATSVVVLGSEVNFLSGVSSNVQAQLDAKQSLDATLTAIAGMTTAADRFIYFSGVDTVVSGTITAVGRDLLDSLTAGEAATAIGAVNLSANNTFTGINTFANATNSTTIGNGAVVIGTGGNSTGIGGGNINTLGVVNAGTELQIAGSVAIDAQNRLASNVWMQGYISGFKMRNNATDPTNDVDINIGVAASAAEEHEMLYHGVHRNPNVTLGTKLKWTTKRLDALHSSGSGSGGLDHGAVANGTYHVHVIENDDFVFSLSHDQIMESSTSIASPCVVTVGVTGDGHGLVVGSTFYFVQNADALPSGVSHNTQYFVVSATETTFTFSASAGGAAVNSSGVTSGTHLVQPCPCIDNIWFSAIEDFKFRRIGSIVRTGGAIATFEQDGDYFYFTTPVVDVSAVATGTSAQTKTLTVPTGIRVKVFGSTAPSASSAFYFSALTHADIAASVLTGAHASATNFSNLWGPVLTSRLGQIRTRSSINVNMTLVTYGWIDTRGRSFP